MPTFDIVSKTDLSEIDNAVANLTREVTQRYDFKGANCEVEHPDAVITIKADEDLKLKQQILADVEAAATKPVIFASNTSALRQAPRCARSSCRTSSSAAAPTAA